MKLSKNFSLNEFHSKDGAEMPAPVFSNIIKLAKDLQVIRDECGCAIHINSAYRSESHNKSIGGVSNSKHLLGMACDLVSRNHTPKQLYDIIEHLIGQGRISGNALGLYNSFVHYDLREKKARW